MNSKTVFWLLVTAVSAATLMVVNMVLIALNTSHHLTISHYLWLLPPAMLIAFSAASAIKENKKSKQ